MVSRAQMNDIQFRLERMRSALENGGIEDWKLQELIEDCAKLRRSDPHGEFHSALGYIQSMLETVQTNLDTVSRLRRNLDQRAS